MTLLGSRDSLLLFLYQLKHTVTMVCYHDESVSDCVGAPTGHKNKQTNDYNKIAEMSQVDRVVNYGLLDSTSVCYINTLSIYFSLLHKHLIYLLQIKDQVTLFIVGTQFSLDETALHFLRGSDVPRPHCKASARPRG